MTMRQRLRWSLVAGVTLVLVLWLAGAGLASGSATPAAPGAAAPPKTASLALQLAGDATGKGTAEAHLSDLQNAPIKGAVVQFTRKTTFGYLALGQVATDGDGIARMELPVHPGQQVEVTAQFAGSSQFAPASARATYAVPSQPVPVRPNGLITPYPNPLFVAILGTVVGGVWFTYGVVFWTLGRIRRAGRTA